MVPFFPRLTMGFFSHMTSSEERTQENGGLDVCFVVSFAFLLFVDAMTAN